ncbi:N4-like RNA polymerase [Escherichia phage K1F]|uniref:DNA-directed RNA polymerase n=3 Tax=root TaxID=1 RepID=Q3YJZ7_BPK1F|nr:N4-like RNA polymerase [Escherichia phage K1F]YP_424916.1 N4-like RNA polymerase [Escherichia phage K1F]AAZ72968.1 RNA polymerase [Escherichia phage K1F]CAJ29347.1 gp1 protein [Escherichia phage K1F]
MSVISIDKHDFSDVSNAIEPFNLLADHYGQDLAVKQLQLEHEAYTEGERRFIKNLERQTERGELADNQVAKPLMQTLVPKIAQAVKEWHEGPDGKLSTSRPSVAFTMLSTEERAVKDRSLRISCESAAVIILKVILSKLVKPEGIPITPMASAIGRTLEDEIRFGRIRDKEKEHFKKAIADNLNKRAGASYKKAYMQAVEASMLEQGQLEDAWGTWSPTEAVHVGIKMLEIVIQSTQLVELKRYGAGNAAADVEMVHLSDFWVKKMAQRGFSLAGIAPVYQPCVVPPKPWTGVVGGGYWAKGRRPLPLIRLGSKSAVARYEDVYMPEVYEAVNIIQNTPWKVNKKVLDVVNMVEKLNNTPIDDIPQMEPLKPEAYAGETEEELKAWKKAAAGIYRREKARQSRRLSLSFIVNQANKFSQFKAIWFPYNMDWRGRVYAVPMFNPQGNDMQKGLLTLAVGKPIGADGFKWLKVHGANCAGVDKVTFEERIKWVEDNHDNIMAAAKAPMDSIEWWGKLDSPFCFLAFCFEYAGVMHHGLSYSCSLPIAFDGSCSGIQHFSAMLRDHIGGHAVNLTPSGKVQDIYRIVSDRIEEELKVLLVNGTDNEMVTHEDKKTGEITERLKLGTRELARQWLTYGMSRKVTKRSVMTLAYGSKEYGFADQVYEDIVMPAIDSGSGAMFTEPSQASRFMAKMIWEAVSVTVVAAVDAMKWLQGAAKLLAAEVKDKKTGEILKPCLPVHWVTPDGFPVWQEYRKKDTTRLNLMFLGSFNLQPTVNKGTKKELDKHKQESGISPNFVHSQDGSHLRKTVVHTHRKYGVMSFAVIHDSFGTIPADAEYLFRGVRETMVETYRDNDVLLDFYEQFEYQLHESQRDKLPELPKKGKLNIEDILSSDFAFA